MAIKKNQLYASLWAGCDELRGGMDASLYKDYVLTLLFLKYVSDKHKHGGGMIEMPTGATFDDIVNLKNTADIGDRLNKIIAQIAEAWYRTTRQYLDDETLRQQLISHTEQFISQHQGASAKIAKAIADCLNCRN